MVNEFLGDRICCGTYAFLNLTHDERIDEELFEISTSVPFGIVHKRYPQYDHLLTPYCDPNEGMDGAIRCWGYQLERESYKNSDEVIEYLKRNLPVKRRVMIGPIDMGKLFYQPLVNLYRRLDHYIVVCMIDKGNVEIVDSEGIVGEVCTFEQLRKSLSVAGIPEAKDRYNVRSMQKIENVEEKMVVQYSLKRAVYNMGMCQKSDDGFEAFQKCWDYLKEIPSHQWSVALLYDFSYVMQRKILHSKLLDLAERYGLLNDREKARMSEIVKRQMVLLGEMFSGLRRGEGLEDELFIEMDDAEAGLADRMLAWDSR
ncbi:hypothetical protein ACQRBN_04500 [Bariatricus sp. SGI.154]|uniref:hypothetical protein n=1 Tax=Bariatricus sp. SGI.154 TaxID=3420549 RepID=UPI003D020BC1